MSRTCSIYGGNAVPFRILQGKRECPDELLLEGPAGTGKSYAIGMFLLAVMDAHPDAVILTLRKTRVSLNDSFLDTWENEILGPDNPMVGGKTREHRSKYVHPNGAEMRLGGFDSPRKLFSTQYHIIFVNEATELTKPELESLHRALRRPGGPGFHLLILDCNPDYGEHHLNRRFPKGHMAERDGKLRVLTRHVDNPTVTKKYLLRLSRSTSGSTRARLYEGLWQSAENLIYIQYDTFHHLLTGKLTWPKDAYDRPIRGERVDLAIQRGVDDDEWEHRELTWFGAWLDFGWEKPGSFGVVGVDGNHRGYVCRETYYSMKEYDWWADAIFQSWQKFRFRFVSADSADPRGIKHINDRCQELGMPRIVKPVDKPARKFQMFNHVRDRLKKRPGPVVNGEPTQVSYLYVLRDILWAPNDEDPVDPRLEENGWPCGLHEEITSLVHRKARETEKGEVPQEESDEGCADHSCDGLGYFALMAWRKDLSKKRRRDTVPLGMDPALMESAATLAKKSRRRRGAL